jgi:hypothetical protein
MAPEYLCQLGNLSCMGCCTETKVQSRKITESQLIINTERFNLIKDPEEFSKDSGPNVDKKSSMCKTLIKEGDKVFCPAHPMSKYTGGKDMRHFCWKDYWCPTMKRYLKMDEKTKEDFVKFIKSKELDWYSYSVGMDSGNLFREFESK